MGACRWSDPLGEALEGNICSPQPCQAPTFYLASSGQVIPARSLLKHPHAGLIVFETVWLARFTLRIATPFPFLASFLAPCPIWQQSYSQKLPANYYASVNAAQGLLASQKTIPALTAPASLQPSVSAALGPDSAEHAVLSAVR